MVPVHGGNLQRLVQFGRDARHAAPGRSWKTELVPPQTGESHTTPHKGSEERQAPSGVTWAGSRLSVAARLAASLDGEKCAFTDG